MFRIVRKGGHLTCRHIQQMLLALSAVGHPAAKARASLYEHYKNIAARPAHELGRERRSAESPSDDCDGQPGHLTVIVSSSHSFMSSNSINYIVNWGKFG